MLPELVKRSSLYILLHKIDQDFAVQYREQRCPFCGASLHQANYERKPRGGPENLPEEFCIRQSLCCSREGCRRRRLPPSCLFLGRRVYWGMVILIVMTLRQNRPEGESTIRLLRKFDLTRKTLFRWLAYYRDIFPQSNQWKRLRGRIGAWVKNDRLPGDLVDHFILHSGNVEQGLVSCLKFIAK